MIPFLDTRCMWTKHNECVETSYSSTGRAHEVNDMNEIITSRDPFENSHGEPALVNSVEDLPPTPTLGLGLTESEARGEETNDSTRETMS